MCVCVCVCVCVYKNIHIYIYTCTNAYNGILLIKIFTKLIKSENL